MSKAIQIAVFCAVMMSAAEAIAKGEGVFESGSGTQDQPWMIANAVQLDQLHSCLGSSYSTAYFALANDIDLTAYLSPGGDGYSKWEAAGWEPIGYPLVWPDRSGSFWGKLNGNGHKVTGLWISRETSSVGLFGCTDEGCEILNLQVEADASQGGVRGGGEVGGVVGFAFESLLVNTCMKGLVRGNGDIGGLVGMVEQTVISNCCAECTVVVEAGGYGGAGGLVGGLHNGLIVSSYADCQVSGGVSYGSAGGFVGNLNTYGTVSNCYSTGCVTGNERVGGAIGSNFGAVSHVYSRCSVVGGTSAGGIVGANGYNGSGAREIVSCYFDVQAAGITNGVGGSDALGGGYGKTVEEMKQQATFVGWDFATVWSIREGLAYPAFRWQPCLPVNIRVTGFSKVADALAFSWKDLGTNVPVVCGKENLSDTQWTPLVSGPGVTVHVQSAGANLVLDAQGGLLPYRFFTVIVP